jgi:type II restriction/modification system DNA methylase subunit YeeA
MEKAAASPTPKTRATLTAKAQALYLDYLERLRRFRVLDPACGSGNFLYLALHALKDLENIAGVEAEALGLTRQLVIGVGPNALHGIEINPYAAELARTALWIGDIQWLQRNGFGVSKDPVLKPLDAIECRDALLTADGTPADWPDADVIIGNPPFIGDKKMKKELGED